MVVHVHVHPDGVRVQADKSGQPSEVSFGGPDLAVGPPQAPSRVVFTGCLFSWEEHYRPIFKKMAPILKQRELEQGRPKSRLWRLSLFTVLLLGTVAAIGCRYL